MPFFFLYSSLVNWSVCKKVKGQHLKHERGCEILVVSCEICSVTDWDEKKTPRHLHPPVAHGGCSQLPLPPTLWSWSSSFTLATPKGRLMWKKVEISFKCFFSSFSFSIFSFFGFLFSAPLLHHFLFIFLPFLTSTHTRHHRATGKVTFQYLLVGAWCRWDSAGTSGILFSSGLFLC